jgi:hypothetical protein
MFCYQVLTLFYNASPVQQYKVTDLIINYCPCYTRLTVQARLMPLETGSRKMKKKMQILQNLFYTHQNLYMTCRVINIMSISFYKSLALTRSSRLWNISAEKIILQSHHYRFRFTLTFCDAHKLLKLVSIKTMSSIIRQGKQCGCLHTLDMHEITLDMTINNTIN